MAGRGPAPKPGAIRQRANQAATATTLFDANPVQGIPPLPDGDWSQSAVKLWRAIWRSPVAREYVRADVHCVLMYLDLWDRYWKEPSVQIAKELRLQASSLGLGERAPGALPRHSL